MMTGFIARAWKTVKPHVPLIKFRKGGTGHSASATSAVSASQAVPSGGNVASVKVPSARTQQLPVIEDWQLPPRYHRLTLDQKEIDAINSGGAF